MRIQPLNRNKRIYFSGIDKPVKLLKREIPIWDTLSFITAFTSMAGFAIGGSGLTSDWLNDLTHNNKKSTTNKLPNAFKDFSKTGKKKNNEGAKIIVPGTK